MGRVMVRMPETGNNVCQLGQGEREEWIHLLAGRQSVL